MCSVSMIGDFYGDKFRQQPWYQPVIPNPPQQVPTPVVPFILSPTREEFDQLKKEVLEMKELLKRAVKYDEENNQPHCETDEKVALLKKIAEYVGVSLEDVLK